MGLYDASLGAMLIATWINSMLWALEIVQVIRVWKNYPDDPRLVRIMMLACLIFDSACTCAACATVYLYTVTNWGNLPALAVQYWTFPMYIISTTATAATVQSFLIYRFFTLSRNKTVTGVFSALVLTAAAGGTYTMFSMILFPAFAERYKIVASAALWLSATTAADIALAAGLVWQFRTIETPFHSTQTLLSKLSSSALQSGLVTSCVALVVLCSFLQNNESNIPVAVNFFLGRVYSHTFLYSLSLRRSSRGDNLKMNTASTSDPTPGAISLTGIHISRSVHVDASSIKQAQPPAPGAWDYRENKISVEDNALAGSPRNFADNVTDV